MISLVVNGVSFSYPQPGDANWGTGATGWAQAVTAGMLSLAGGSFALTAQVDFGASFGVKVLSLTSETANAALTGYLRLASADLISWRNNANSADIALGKNSSDQLTYSGAVIASASGIIPLSAGGTGASLTAAAGGVPYSTGSAFAILGAGISGQVLTSGGASAPTWGSALSNPMSTLGDLIYGGASGAATRLAGDTSNTRKFLREVSSGGVAAAPAWDTIQAADVPTLNQNTTGNAATATTAGTVTTANGVTNALLAQMPPNTIKGNNTGGTSNAVDLTAAQVKALTNSAPTLQKFLSGSGTYTAPTSPAPLYLRVRMVGGGGGGAGSGTSQGAGGVGGTSTFGTTLLSCIGGGGGGAGSTSSGGGGGVGGTASLGSGPIGVTLTGGRGQGGGIGSVGTAFAGGDGGDGPFGGGGGGAAGDNINTGYPGASNTGGGGGGAGIFNVNLANGAGGGSGGFVDAIISGATLTSTFAYSVGAAGTAGIAGTSGFAGGAGGSGYIEVTEYYQ